MSRSGPDRRRRRSFHRPFIPSSTTPRLAPSGHNAQPWSVRLDAGQIWIGTDSTRWLPQVDPTNREATLSVGAFVENLITAAPAHGFVADYEVVGTRPP